MAKVLIIDDDQAMCCMLAGMVTDMGHTASYATNIKEGLQTALGDPCDVVFLDVRMPDGNGLDALPKIRQTASQPEVIIITGYGDPDGAEMAIKNGAWDYLQKPFSPEKYLLPLSRVLQHRDAIAEAKKELKSLKRGDIVGNCPQMTACYDLLAQAASSDAAVLVTGETGTGKDLFARAIHQNSPRADKRFVVVDCAALPETLVENVLFGHIKGAYTGAEQSHEGLIRQADGGTLFLDEVGELPLNIQKNFLRVLQEHRFLPVGGKQEVHSNFRLVAATNRDLEGMAAAGLFRKDLLFRIKALTIILPPLREHREDIKDIAIFHMTRFSERNRIGTKGLCPEFLTALEQYAWPGNVRELVNVLETASTAARLEDTLLTRHLPMHIRIQSARASVADQACVPADFESLADMAMPLPGFRERMEEIEKSYLKELISSTEGNIKAALEISGLSRSRLYALFKKHDITRKYATDAV